MSSVYTNYILYTKNHMQYKILINSHIRKATQRSCLLIYVACKSECRMETCLNDCITKICPSIQCRIAHES